MAINDSESEGSVLTKPINRRNFLQKAAAGILATVLPSPSQTKTPFGASNPSSNLPSEQISEPKTISIMQLPKPTQPIKPNPPPPTPVLQELSQNSSEVLSKPNLTDEERELTRKRIIELQQSIGIYQLEKPGDPMFDAFVAKRKEWGAINDNFQNELPASISNFGELAKIIVTQAFQENAGRMIKGARLDVQIHNQMAFNHSTDRFIALFPEIAELDEKTSLSYVPGAMIHELLGHGSDPEFLSKVYPYDALLQLELCQWELLSKVASIPDAFINNPSHLISRELAIRIGNKVGQHFQTDKINTSSEDTKQIAELLASSFRSIDPHNKVLNSNVCYEFGVKLLKQISEGKIHLPEGIRSDYADAWFDKSHQNINNSRSEMYADMVSIIIMNPDLSPQLFQVCQKILSIYSPDNQVHFKDIGKKVTFLTQEIFAHRKPATPQSKTEAPKLTRQEENYQCFISTEACKTYNHGFLENDESTIPSDVDNNLHLFRDNILEIYIKYPTLSGSNSLHINPNFSPTDLTPEQADSLRNFADSNYIRGLLETLNSGKTLTDLEKNNLEQKAKGLYDFLNHK